MRKKHVTNLAAKRRYDGTRKRTLSAVMTSKSPSVHSLLSVISSWPEERSLGELFDSSPVVGDRVVADIELSDA